jgi:hypothetical protein
MRALCICPKFLSVGVARTSFLARKAGLKFGGLRGSVVFSSCWQTQLLDCKWAVAVERALWGFGCDVDHQRSGQGQLVSGDSEAKRSCASPVLARKLAVLMHRMWVDGESFRWSTADPVQAA